MRIFLSSTYMDLMLHRKAVVDALDRLDLQVGRMEVFGARPEEPVTACLTEVAECDLFIGLYAHRYGFIPAGSDVSITEAEFDHARKANKPIFCFVVDEDHPWHPKMIEDEPGKARLQAFKAKVSTGVVRDTFTTPEDLAVKLATTIGRYLSRKTPATREVQVKRVTDPEDEDLDAAFILCERRIPDPNLRDNSADIRRWLGELRDEKAAGSAELDDYLLIAKTRTEVCGFFYAQFYPKSGFLFVSYLVADEQTVTSRKETTRAIGEYLKLELERTLQGCRAIVFELASPSPTAREEWVARFRCFAQMARTAGVTIKWLDVPYVQPRLSPFEEDGYKEEYQRLFYGHANTAPLEATVPRGEVVELLRVLYTEWYAQAFEDDPDTKKMYSDYLQQLFLRVAASIPAAVPALDGPRPRRSSSSKA